MQVRVAGSQIIKATKMVCMSSLQTQLWGEASAHSVQQNSYNRMKEEGPLSLGHPWEMNPKFFSSVTSQLVIFCTV
jgi:hypothetical protein